MKFVWNLKMEFLKIILWVLLFLAMGTSQYKTGPPECHDCAGVP